MASEKILTVVLAIVIFFNLIFFITGYTADMINASSILGYFVSVAIIGVIISIIPTTSASGAVTYLLSGVLMMMTLYGFDFTVGGYHVQLGIGLVSNLAGMFSSNPNSLAFLPYLFFNALGLLGVLSGIIILAGGNQ
jgi:hypothetical protein